MYTILLFLCAGLARLGHAAYWLRDDYKASNWVDMFNFETMDDPTHGYVNYVDLETAQDNGLFWTENDVVSFGSDSNAVASGRGRNSVRLISKNQYTHGLVVIDVAHMPGNACGIWPAFWMFGPEWPNSGEIDIIEGVNMQWGNKATMHTSDGCSFDGSSCLGNLGCSKPAGGSNAYGDEFNANRGGVYALEWNANHIKLWFFGRGSEPADVLGDTPDPSQWGYPTATFAGGNGCEIDSHFRNQNIVFDTTFCGDWAGQVFNQDSTCAATGLSCDDYVKNHPEAFSEAYWTVNALKVYSDDGNGPPVLSSRDNTPASTPAVSVFLPRISVNASTPTSLRTAPGDRSLGFISWATTPLAEITTVPTSPEQAAGTDILSAFGSAATTTVNFPDGVVITETEATAVVSYSAVLIEDGNSLGGHDGHEVSARSQEPLPIKQKRGHRAARHLKNHRFGVFE